MTLFCSFHSSFYMFIGSRVLSTRAVIMAMVKTRNIMLSALVSISSYLYDISFQQNQIFILSTRLGYRCDRKIVDLRNGKWLFLLIFIAIYYFNNNNILLFFKKRMEIWKNKMTMVAHLRLRWLRCLLVDKLFNLVSRLT